MIDNDPLWSHFKPLWFDFMEVSGGICVAGGYGLFLKQQWLLAQNDPAVLAPPQFWPDSTPRATKDVDLVLDLNLIADKTTNVRLFEVLKKQGFEVSTELHGKNWQFYKKIGEGRHIIAELHAQTPGNDIKNLVANTFAVKHKPSLGDRGIHGRHNAEAVGSELLPFRFQMDEVDICVPNPVTWSIMKLTAAKDQWDRSQKTVLKTEKRDYSRAQAIKHGHDVCRVVAMMTIGERDRATEVIDAIRSSSQFEKTSIILREFFFGNLNWGSEVLKGRWLTEDFSTIQEILTSWFDEKK